jgi:hypothetical protein
MQSEAVICISTIRKELWSGSNRAGGSLGVYSLDTLQENSLLMALKRNRLLAGESHAHKGSYEQVDSFLWLGAFGTDQLYGTEDGHGRIGIRARLHPGAAANRRWLFHPGTAADRRWRFRADQVAALNPLARK